ncbi:MAG: hypothetical protein WKF93_11555 [Acidimicrobiales bacterium]
MIPRCDHHEHEFHSVPEDALAAWTVWIGGEDGQNMGSWCSDHLGDGVSDIEGTITLTRTDEP